MNTDSMQQYSDGESTQSSASTVNFELRSLKETWSSVLNNQPSCGTVSCVTITCVCCDPGSKHPPCPALPDDNEQ